jgi:hypothetical protein
MECADSYFVGSVNAGREWNSGRIEREAGGVRGSARILIRAGKARILMRAL